MILETPENQNLAGGCLSPSPRSPAVSSPGQLVSALGDFRGQGPWHLHGSSSYSVTLLHNKATGIVFPRTSDAGFSRWASRCPGQWRNPSKVVGVKAE